MELYFTWLVVFIFDSDTRAWGVPEPLHSMTSGAIVSYPEVPLLESYDFLIYRDNRMLTS